MKVVAFNGSPRKKGNTAMMLGWVMEQLEKEGIDTEIVHVGRDIHPCIACYKCASNKDRRCTFDDDGVNGYLEKMFEADGILLGSPTYFADVSAQMKALIDRCGLVARVNGNLLSRKVGAGVVAVRRAGAVHVFSSLNYFFLIAEMVVPGSVYWNLGIGKAPGDVANDAEGKLTMERLGENMAWVMSRLNL